jgi:hypothetical protein
MIIIETKKPREQVIELLRKQTRHFKIYHLIFPVISYALCESTFAGRINENKFWLFSPSLATARLPHRVFFGTFTETDNKTIIIGKFKYPPSLYINYLIVLMLLIFVGFITGVLPPFDIGFIIFPLFMIAVLPFGILIGKKCEKETIENIKKFLDADTGLEDI